MPRSITGICNEAISDLPAHPITDITASDKEAKECARHLPGVVAELLSVHDFTFANRRITLSEIENDRPGEWAKAYDLPNAVLSPIRLIPNYQSTSNSNLSIETGGVTSTSGGIVLTPVLYWRGSWPDIEVVDYLVADGKLYTNIEEPILEYSLDALEPEKWTPLFAQAVIRLLASRIYRPVMGEKGDTREWVVKQQAARAALNEAVADDLNRNPRRRRRFRSEAEIAREGSYDYDLGMGDFGWRR